MLAEYRLMTVWTTHYILMCKPNSNSRLARKNSRMAAFFMKPETLAIRLSTASPSRADQTDKMSQILYVGRYSELTQSARPSCESCVFAQELFTATGSIIASINIVEIGGFPTRVVVLSAAAVRRPSRSIPSASRTMAVFSSRLSR